MAAIVLVITFLITIPTYISGCMTVKPQITASHFRACEQLCRGNKGASKMYSVIEVNYAGTTTVLSEKCACKNNRTFDIISSQD